MNLEKVGMLTIKNKEKNNYKYLKEFLINPVNKSPDINFAF